MIMKAKIVFRGWSDIKPTPVYIYLSGNNAYKVRQCFNDSVLNSNCGWDKGWASLMTNPVLNYEETLDIIKEVLQDNGYTEIQVVAE